MSNKNVIISIKGRIPSKKNSRNVFAKNGRLFNIPSKQYAAWHKDAMEQLKDCRGFGIISKVDNIELRFFAPDKRKFDLTNKAESIMDLLVDFGLLQDDNCEVVRDIRMIYSGVDKVNPRCDVTIDWQEES